MLDGFIGRDGERHARMVGEPLDGHRDRFAKREQRGGERTDNGVHLRLRVRLGDLHRGGGRSSSDERVAWDRSEYRASRPACYGAFCFCRLRAGLSHALSRFFHFCKENDVLLRDRLRVNEQAEYFTQIISIMNVISWRERSANGVGMRAQREK